MYIRYGQLIAHSLTAGRFNADTSTSMAWSFKPQQREVKVC